MNPFTRPKATLLETAFDRYYPAVFRFFCYRGADAQTSNDLAASVFERALTYLHQYDPRKAQIQTWLFAIARNISINHWKSEKETVPLDDELPEEELPLEELVIQSYDKERVLLVLQSLDNRSREILALKFGSFMTSLDGSNRQTISQGIYPSLSPDGKYVAFAWGEGLNIADLQSGAQYHIPNTTTADNVPVWSPDGTKIAFSNGSDLNLYTINPDGSGRTRVLDVHGDEQLVDWTPDGMDLIYGVSVEAGISLRKVEVASGSVTELSVIANRRAYEDFSISPDGNRIAYHARENLSDAIYIANLDGSDRRLFAQLGSWIVTAPFWSPDGNWLIVIMRSTDLPDRPTELALVNVQDCRIHPLPLSVESIHGWIP